MILDVPSYIWLVLAVAMICTSWITSEVSKLGSILEKLEKRGGDIEYKLLLMQHSIDHVAGSVDSVEENTRPSGDLN